jgi:hypothetical protein
MLKGKNRDMKRTASTALQNLATYGMVPIAVMRLMLKLTADGCRAFVLQHGELHLWFKLVKNSPFFHWEAAADVLTEYAKYGTPSLISIYLNLNPRCR